MVLGVPSLQLWYYNCYSGAWSTKSGTDETVNYTPDIHEIMT